jgi:hypothetical protein
VRAYLDHFGFSYYVTEVDSYDKAQLTKFTKARALPILVLEDKLSKNVWHLANATTILSALESLKAEKLVNFANVLNLHLPTLKGSAAQLAKNPHKYHVTNSNLKYIEEKKIHFIIISI